MNSTNFKKLIAQLIDQRWLILFASFIIPLLFNSKLQGQCITSSEPLCNLSGIPCGTTSPENVTVRVYLHIIKNSSCGGGLTESQVEALKQYLTNVYGNHNISFNFPECNLELCDNLVYGDISNVVSYFATRSIPDGINGYISTNAGGGLAQSIPAINFYSSADFPVVAHELGHCLGLLHTHECTGSTNECVDRSNGTTAGDLVCDTNADPSSGVNQSTCTRDDTNPLYDDNPTQYCSVSSCSGLRYDPPIF